MKTELTGEQNAAPGSKVVIGLNWNLPAFPGILAAISFQAIRA